MPPPAKISTVTQQLAQKVDLMAERSSNPVIKQAIPAWPAPENRNRQTLDALAEVDAGRTIEHQSVQVWADSLTDNPSPGSS